MPYTDSVCIHQHALTLVQSPNTRSRDYAIERPGVCVCVWLILTVRSSVPTARYRTRQAVVNYTDSTPRRPIDPSASIICNFPAELLSIFFIFFGERPQRKVKREMPRFGHEITLQKSLPTNGRTGGDGRIE